MARTGRLNRVVFSAADPALRAVAGRRRAPATACRSRQSPTGSAARPRVHLWAARDCRPTSPWPSRCSSPTALPPVYCWRWIHGVSAVWGANTLAEYCTPASSARSRALWGYVGRHTQTVCASHSRNSVWKASGCSTINQCPVLNGTTRLDGRWRSRSSQASAWNMNGLCVP